MSLGINTNYGLNNYNKTNVNKKAADEKTVSADDSTAVSNTVSKTKSNATDEYYEKLCSKFPNIVFGVHHFSGNSPYPSTQDWRNTTCVTIDPAYLRKAADPKVAEDLEKKLSDFPEANAWLYSTSTAMGKKVTSAGTYIDANGGFSSSMSIEELNNSGNDNKTQNKKSVFLNIDDIIEKQLEKLKEERKEETKRQAAIKQKDIFEANLKANANKSYKNNSNTLLSKLNINLVDSNV